MLERLGSQRALMGFSEPEMIIIVRLSCASANFSLDELFFFSIAVFCFFYLSWLTTLCSGQRAGDISESSVILSSAVLV